MVSIHMPVTPERTPVRGRLRPTSAPSVRACRKQVFAPPPVCPHWPARESKAARELSGRFALGLAGSGPEESTPPVISQQANLGTACSSFQPFSSRRVVGSSAKSKLGANARNRPSSAPASRRDAHQTDKQDYKALQDALVAHATSISVVAPSDTILPLQDQNAAETTVVGVLDNFKSTDSQDSSPVQTVDKDMVLQLLCNLDDAEARWVLEKFFHKKPNLQQDLYPLKETNYETNLHRKSHEIAKSTNENKNALSQSVALVGFVKFWVTLHGGNSCAMVIADPLETLQDLQPRICARLGFASNRKFRLIFKGNVLSNKIEVAELEGQSLIAVQVPVETWCTGKRFSMRTEEGTNEVVTQISSVELIADGSFKYEWHYKYHDAWDGDTVFKDDVAIGVWELLQSGNLVVLHGELLTKEDSQHAPVGNVMRSKKRFSKSFTKAELSTWEIEVLEN